MMIIILKTQNYNINIYIAYVYIPGEYLMRLQSSTITLALAQPPKSARSIQRIKESGKCRLMFCQRIQVPLRDSNSFRGLTGWTDANMVEMSHFGYNKWRSVHLDLLRIQHTTLEESNSVIRDLLVYCFLTTQQWMGSPKKQTLNSDQLHSDFNPRL